MTAIIIPLIIRPDTSPNLISPHLNTIIHIQSAYIISYRTSAQLRTTQHIKTEHKTTQYNNAQNILYDFI